MEVTIKGAAYQIRKLNPIQQFHIARRLAPALWALSSATESFALAKPEEGMLFLYKPVAEAFAKMTDEDTEYVLNTCLAAVFRQQGHGWAPVSVKGSQALMFDDIDLPVMMQLAFEVIKENLGNFFDALPAM